MTSPAPTVARTITADEICDVTHYCHWIASRQGKRSAVMYRFADYTAFELLTALQAVRAVKRDNQRQWSGRSKNSIFTTCLPIAELLLERWLKRFFWTRKSFTFLLLGDS